MTLKAKTLTLIVGIAAAFGLIGGLLWYYQKQGIIKVFPTAEDRRIKKILTIDRTKFRSADGLSNEEFEKRIQILEEQKQKILENPKDAQRWFNFGYTKEFLNDHEGAVLAWEKALELQPLNFVTALNLGNTYQYFLKNYPKAEENYQKALALRPDYTSAYQGLIDLYRFNFKEKQKLLAPLLLEAVKNDQPNAHIYYGALIEFYAANNDFNQAKQYLAEVRRLKPKLASQLLEQYPELK